MEPIFLIVALFVIAVGGLLVVSARRRPGGELEPPPTASAIKSASAPTTEVASEEIAASDLAAGDPTPAATQNPPAEHEPDPVTKPEATAEAAPVADADPPTAAEPEVKPKFRDRLTKARDLLSGYVGSVLSRTSIDNQVWDDIEEALIRADVGVGITTRILDDLRAKAGTEGVKTPAELLDALKADLKEMLASGERGLTIEAGHPNVWLFVGVNGVGKTTTIGKLGKQAVDDGRSVLMAAGDTFRAAAADQLQLWAERVGAEIVRGAEGGDPASVIFDAVQSAAARDIDLVLADTAGRLHTKVNLMEELKKVRRVAEREPGKVSEVLLVIDATTGQNGLVQAKQFTDAVQVTGIVLTKLDGTAKGGIALAIQGELGIPIKLVGLGEGAADLIEFDPEEFVEALFE